VGLVTKDIRHDHEGRVERLRARMAEQNVDGVYLCAGMNMFYFLGFTGYSGGWPIWLTGAVVPREGEVIAFCNDMHRDIAAYGQTLSTDLRTHRDGDDVLPIMREILRDAGVASGRLGIEANLWSAERSLVAEAAPAVEFVDFQDPIDDMRMVKDELEISLIRKACEASMAGFKATHETAKVGTPGKEVAMAVFDAMTANGTIAAPMHIFRHFIHREMRDGDIICADLGGKYRNYGSDAARTVYVGSITDDLKRINDIILDSRKQLLEMIRPGIRVEDIHDAACRLVERTGYSQPWRIGHGIGLGPSHEMPLLQYGSRVVTEPGMIFVIDPGIHYPDPDRDLPIAIEDVVLVTEDGYELLTPYQPEVITDK